MAEQSAAVIPSHPPEPIMKLMNPILRYGLRTPLAGGARKQFMVLNFTGRKSGRQFEHPGERARDRRRAVRAGRARRGR